MYSIYQHFPSTIGFVSVTSGVAGVVHTSIATECKGEGREC